MPIRSIRFTALASILVTCLFVQPANAQSTPRSQDETEVERQPICMARAQRDVPHVKAAQRGKNFFIVAAPRTAPSFEAKGFSRISCQEAGLTRATDLLEYRNRVCEMAAYGNGAIQNQIERAIGERPAVLCANAEWFMGRMARERAKEDTRE